MSAKKNKYCSLSALANESDVEQFFVMPLMAELGFGAEYLDTKKMIPAYSIGKGKKKKSYLPDYLGYPTKSKRKVILIVDAKHPDESAEEGVNDAQLYASVIRRKMKSPKPDQYCIGVNGHHFVVKHYDSDSHLFDLSFANFTDDSPAFQKLKVTLSRDALARASLHHEPIDDFEFRNVSPLELPAIFEACHRALWKAEKRSPASAFYEFAKIMYVKIHEDRRLREYLATHGHDLSSGVVPRNLVRFSVHWIEEMEDATDNPIDSILFAQLSKKLEDQIAKGDKKRIFEQKEGIDLAPGTIKDAVAYLEHLDLFAVDEDLNGRLFETFLTATMRGEALGQFFTPRSVVKFMVKVANLQALPHHMDFVLDGCCGTGGFLIQAMADMSAKIEGNRALTERDRSRLHRKLRRENLWGIDAGKDPQMARIARLNMLLHKDGGSRIYFADALDKQLRAEPGLPVQTKREIAELRGALASRKFSCILSNPPFSMTYEKKKPNERAVLVDYVLAVDAKGRPRTSLRSSVMFLERYWDLLTDDGQLITVMDESVLNTLTSKIFREFLLNMFFLKAVISLPRNTFVKAQGRVKTSVLYLQKKVRPEDKQPDVFMAIVNNVGHSDTGKDRPHLNELPRVLEALQHYEKTGKLKSASATVFKAGKLDDENPTLRLDAHFFDPRYFKTMNVLEDVAKKRGWKIKALADLLRSKPAGGATPRGASYPDEGPKFIRVQNVRPYRIVWSEEDDPCVDTRTHTVLLKRSQLSAEDLVLTITGTYGVAGVVPADFGPANINQHSVRLQSTEEIRPDYLCVFLNSELCRPQFERAVTGSSRPALDYESIKKVRILFPEDKDEQKQVAQEVMSKLKEASGLQKQADSLIDALPKIPSV